MKISDVKKLTLSLAIKIGRKHNMRTVCDALFLTQTFLFKFTTLTETKFRMAKLRQQLAKHGYLHNGTKLADIRIPACRLSQVA